MDNNSHNERAGSYLGTEINEKWWRRYTKNKMLARGAGKFWHDGDAIFFLRKLTKEPISISLQDVVEYKTGKWHSGKWAGGNPVLKVIWRKDGLRLCSGFTVSQSLEEVEELMGELKAAQEA